MKVWIFECRDPSHKAFKLGLSAAIILALAHTIGNLLGGFFCLWSKQDFNNASANKKLAFGSLLLSWYAYFNTQFQMNSLLIPALIKVETVAIYRITLALGFSLLIAGAMANSKSRKSCALANQRILSIGGILCFFHGLFTVAYYVSAKATIKDETKLKNPSNHGGHPPA